MDNNDSSDKLLEQAKHVSEGEKDKDALNRQIRAFSSAMPFVDPQTRKMLFIAVKALEIRRFEQDSGGIFAAEAKGTPEERRRGFIKEVCKCLEGGERRRFEMICAFIQMNNGGIFGQGGQK